MSGPAARPHPSWRIAAVVVSVASLAWVLWLLAAAWPDLSAHRRELRVGPLLEGFTLATLGSVCAFAAFVILARMFGISGLSRRDFAHFYFTGQLLKHLPGRIWGIGYQWAANPAIGSFQNWLLANLAHLLLAAYFALWIAALVLASLHVPWWGAAVLLAGSVCYAAGWRIAALLANLPWPGWVPDRLGRLREGIALSLARASSAQRAWIFCCFLASSLCYYLSWYLYGESYPPLGAKDGVQLCAYYMIAWLVGYLSLLTPSGLGVRELAFAWMAKDFPGDSIAYLAVVGRASLLAVDLLLGLVSVPLSPRKR